MRPIFLEGPTPQWLRPCVPRSIPVPFQSSSCTVSVSSTEYRINCRIAIITFCPLHFSQHACLQSALHAGSSFYILVLVKYQSALCSVCSHLIRRPQLQLGNFLPVALRMRTYRRGHFLSVCRLSVVCLSVTFMRPTQAVEIFGNISTALGTWAIH